MLGRNFGEFALTEHLVEKFWQMNRSTNRLSILTTNLDGFSLVNHGQFAKLFHYMVLILAKAAGETETGDLLKTKNRMYILVTILIVKQP